MRSKSFSVTKRFYLGERIFMKKLISLIISGILIISSMGCGNLSPRDNFSPKLQEDINNTNGKIDRIENNQNSIHGEIEKLLSFNKTNNGIQILQGDGALILVFSLCTIGIIFIYLYQSG